MLIPQTCTSTEIAKWNGKLNKTRQIAFFNLGVGIVKYMLDIDIAANTLCVGVFGAQTEFPFHYGESEDEFPCQHSVPRHIIHIYRLYA